MQTSRGGLSFCVLVALTLCLAAPASLHGAAARLPMDAHAERLVDPSTLTGSGYLPPSQFAVLGGRAVFFVSLGNLLNPFLHLPGPGVALWVSDGTPQGTELIAGFCTDEITGCWNGPRFLGQVGGVVLFEIAKGYGDSNHELWRTDGTREGTFRLQSEVCRLTSSDSEVVAGGRLFFAASDADAGCELWQSDGTTAGTMRVADLVTGTDPSVPRSFAVLGGRVFFTTFYPLDQAGRTGLWVTDGTSGGTSLVQAIPFINLMTVVGQRLFFISSNASFVGFSLWTSDGTAAGTRQVRHFAVYEVCDYLTKRQCDFLTTFLQPDGDGVIFVADDGDHPQLWRSDGTPEGTSRLTSIAPPASLATLERGVAVRLSGSLLFLFTPDERYVRLWTANGGPALPLTGCAGGCPVVSAPTPEIHPVPGGRLVVFAGWNGHAHHGVELWASDGTAAGTRMVRDLCPGRCSSYPLNFFTLGDAVYFTASTADDENDPGLWRTDGTAAGTVLLGRTALPPASPGGAVLGSQVLLGLTTGTHPSELWTTSGSEASTHPVATFDRMTFSSDPSFASLGDRVVFTTEGVRDLTLWSSDGLHTRPLITASQAAGEASGPYFSDSFSPPVAAGGRAFTFVGYADGRGIHQAHLVVTDGTPQGTRTLADLGDTYVREPHEFGGRLVFVVASADPEHSKCELWSSDGTSLGTRKLLDLPVLGVLNLQPVGGFLYFFDGVALYRTDGTQAGTARFTDFQYLESDSEVAAAGGQVYLAARYSLYHVTGTSFEPSAAFDGWEVMGLTELDGRLLFFGVSRGDTPQRGLWSTDGTAAGTVFLGPVSTQPPNLRLGAYGLPVWSRAGRRLLFRGWDPDHGFELWSTDGTAAGTVRMDLAPGSASSYPNSFAAAAGRVWLTANDPAHGREIWVSDGTPAGTHQADEIVPGMFSALPMGLTPAGNNLYFSASTPFDGRQPWVLPLAGIP